MTLVNAFQRLILRRNVLDDQKREILMIDFRFFLIHPMFFFLIIFFYGIILKRKEFVIQWRKFGLKRSSTFKVMNCWSLCLFVIFILFLNAFFKTIFFIKIAKKGLLTCRWWRGEQVHVASWCGTLDHRSDATRLCGHVAGPRVAHARRRRRTGRRHVAGGHACPRVHADARVGRHVAGEGRHMEGPRVSGPW